LQVAAVAGRALSEAGQALSIRGSSLGVTLPEAQVVRADLDFAAGKGRVGECVFASCRAFMQAALDWAEVTG
jgi:hypothetical protein